MDLLKPHDNLEIKNGQLFVNGEEFLVSFPSEPLHSIEEGNLVTIFRGHLRNYWNYSDIKGQFKLVT
jgi:hypothetical protein